MNKQMHKKPLDVAIAGAGIAGLALAAAVKQTLGSGFSVGVFDPALGRDPAKDDRVVAVAEGARHLFETLNVWEQLSDVQPIRAMEITDSKLYDAVRQTFLEFAEGDAGEPLAHMVENRALASTLRKVAEELDVGLISTSIETYAPDESLVRFDSAGYEYQARLLAAADGAQSKLRALARIQTITHSYDQSGIVATIGHARPHDGKAVQHFLPSGSFAFLPLSGNRSSIVWTESTSDAQRIVALPAAEFLGELELRFGLRLGELELVSAARAYPLRLSIARTFIAERLALVGDAAHVIHPLAGQGLNMGLRDVAALTECIADHVRLGLDPGAPEVLSRYQRWRRADTLTMGIATDGINRLFSNNSTALKYLRDFGLGLVDRAPALKRFFAREAAGISGEVPKLMRGEFI